MVARPKMLTCSQLERPAGLAKLILTCKSLHANVTPHLYQHVIIRVPLKWDSLNSLDSLICPDAASVSNLRYCRSLSIKTQQTLPDLVYDGRKYETSRDDEDCPKFQLHKPTSCASNALNDLIRFILLRLPKHTLQTFW